MKYKKILLPLTLSIAFSTASCYRNDNNWDKINKNIENIEKIRAGKIVYIDGKMVEE